VVSEPTPDLPTQAGPDRDSGLSAFAGLWSSLREIGLWRLMRLMPGLVRSAFAGREPAADPVVSRHQHRDEAQDAALDFTDSAVTGPDQTAAAVAETTGPAVEVDDAGLAAAIAEVVDALDVGADHAAETAAGQDSARTSESAASASSSEAVAELGEVAW
jgi:hypothetical protein